MTSIPSLLSVASARSCSDAENALRIALSDWSSVTVGFREGNFRARSPRT